MNDVLNGYKVVARKLAPAPDFLTFGDDSHSNCSRYMDDKRFVIKGCCIRGFIM